MAYPLHPTVSFILPVENEVILTIAQINSCFQFSERYPELCEIIIVTDDPADNRVGLLWAATNANKINHPCVRTKIIRYTSKQGIRELVETGMKQSLGANIVIVTNNWGKLGPFNSEMLNMVKGNILITPHLLNIDALHKALVKN